MPAMISTPPRACISVGTSPSANQANTIAKRTSVRPTNEESAAPRTRVAPMPATNAMTAAITDRPATGTSQLT
jgi:hypothetical protein